MNEFNKPTNPQAFPNPHLRDDSGITMRDYFAASFVKSGHIFKNMSDGNTPALVAKQAYILANAMLKERAK